MSKRILVIEDEESFRDILEEILVNAGFEVEVSPYLATAVGEGLSGKYDLITLDLSMPEMDGLEIARLFSRQEIETPVLVISGYLDASMTDQLKATGIRHFLHKPSGVPQLIKAVKKALNNNSTSH